MKLLGVVTVVLVLASSAAAGRTVTAACSPGTAILKSPRSDSLEVQVKALNDRGDAVGFADAGDGTRLHAILWRAAGEGVDLGMLPGYASSEAYGINDAGVVFGLLYDRRDRTYPFRWQNGRMTLLKGPDGRVVETSGNPGSGGRNAVNSRGEMAWTLMVGGNPRAVRWSAGGKATLLPRLVGHKWSWAFGINDQGVVSGWSRKLPSEDGEENPVVWTRDGKIVPLQTVEGQADGIAEATNRSGLSVGYLGNLGTDVDPEHDQFAVWRTRTAAPLLFGPVRNNLIAEFVDVNDRGQVVGMTGPLDPKTGFGEAQGVTWQSGWKSVKPLAVPPGARKHVVLVTQLNDVNNRGAVVGNVFGLAAKDYAALRGIYPVLWTCAFAR